MSDEQKYIDRLLEIARLYLEEFGSVSAQEIAEAYIGHEDVGKGIVREITSKLGTLRKRLDEEGALVYAVTAEYYNSYRGLDPEERTAILPKECLPRKGHPAVGICLHEEVDDPIYTAKIGNNLAAAGGKVSRNMKRMETAFGKGLMTVARIREIGAKGRPRLPKALVEAGAFPTPEAPALEAEG